LVTPPHTTKSSAHIGDQGLSSTTTADLRSPDSAGPAPSLVSMAIRRLHNPIQWVAASVYWTGGMFVVSAPAYLDPWPAAALKLTLTARLMDATDQMFSADVTPQPRTSRVDLGQVTVAGLRHPLPET